MHGHSAGQSGSVGAVAAERGRPVWQPGAGAAEYGPSSVDERPTGRAAAGAESHLPAHRASTPVDGESTSGCHPCCPSPGARCRPTGGSTHAGHGPRPPIRQGGPNPVTKLNQFKSLLPFIASLHPIYIDNYQNITKFSISRSLLEKAANLEAELRATEPLKTDVLQARSDCQKLHQHSQELGQQVRTLTTELQRARADVQLIPTLRNEAENLRSELQRARYISKTPQTCT